MLCVNPHSGHAAPWQPQPNSSMLKQGRASAGSEGRRWTEYIGGRGQIAGNLSTEIHPVQGRVLQTLDEEHVPVDRA
jgi:hypothetical protein